MCLHLLNASKDTSDLRLIKMGQNDGRPAVKGKIVFETRPRKSKNVDNFHCSNATILQYTYPLKLLVPQHASSSSCCWFYVLTYGGGLVEGDDVTLSVDIHDRCCAMLTTQGFTKVYHCEGGKESRQRLDCVVGQNALLAILPDPVVCFKDAIYSQRQIVHLQTSSNLIMLDWLTAGRVALGEMWEFTRYQSKNTIQYGDRVVFCDNLNLCDRQNISLLEAMQGYQIVGMLVLLGPMLESITSKLIQDIGKPHSYGQSYDANMIVSVSPLKYEISDEVVKGCVVRITATSTEPAMKEIEKLLTPLFLVLGGNPFANKY